MFSNLSPRNLARKCFFEDALAVLLRALLLALVVRGEEKVVGFLKRNALGTVQPEGSLGQ
jgi:hypothetical protein